MNALKLSGKYLTKEGNKCNFLSSDHNIKARIGKFCQRHDGSFSLYVACTLQGEATTKNEWEMISSFSQQCFLFILSVLMVRWRYG